MKENGHVSRHLPFFLLSRRTAKYRDVTVIDSKDPLAAIRGWEYRIEGRGSCRTLNELNQLVGRHSMIHLLCVQILAFLSVPKGKWRKAQLLHDLNETLALTRPWAFVYQ